MHSSRGNGLFTGDGAKQDSGKVAKDVIDIVDSYFEIYMITNITRLMSAVNSNNETTKEILLTLDKLDVNQLEKILAFHYGDNNCNIEIKSIYRVLNRLLTGNATETDIVIKAILSMKLNLPLEKICTQVSTQLNTRWQNYLRETDQLNNIPASQPTARAGDASVAPDASTGSKPSM